MNDSVQNVFYDGVKRSIEVCLSSECYMAAVTLIYTGIDAMAFLSMPKNCIEVNSGMFMDWCDKYLNLPGVTHVTGEEFYAARCGVVHSYGIHSRLTRKGVRKIGYMYRAEPATLANPNVDPYFVVVSVEALARCFFVGLDRSLKDVFGDPEKRLVAEERLREHYFLQRPTDELLKEAAR